MITKKEFYFIRHGQTNGNLPEFLGKDFGDLSLNEKGVEEARMIAPKVSSLPIKTICHSPLQRVKETRDICCAGLSAAHHEIHHLSECSADIWQKMTTYMHADEGVAAFMERVLLGVNQALAQEGPVLIIAHGGVYWALCSFLGVDHHWVIGHCLPVHFSVSVTGDWIARCL